MMRLFSLLVLFSVFYMISREGEMFRFQERLSDMKLGIYERDIKTQIFPAFTFYEVTLLALVFILASLTLRKQRMNKRLHYDIGTMKNRISKSTEVVGKLSTYLEASRSRNSGIESPLRRTKRSVEIMINEIERQSLHSDKLVQEFNNFRGRYLKESFSLSDLSINNMEQLRIKAELAMLRRFIIGEVNALRKVGDYFKALVDEAEDDVSRVLASEGF